LRRQNDINPERNQLGRESGEPLVLPLGKSVLDYEVATLDVTEVAQSLEEGLSQAGGRGRIGRQVAYSRDPVCLLGPGGERCGDGTGQRGQQEAAAVHYSIT
jgi:hypothetical protein